MAKDGRGGVQEDKTEDKGITSGFKTATEVTRLRGNIASAKHSHLCMLSFHFHPIQRSPGLGTFHTDIELNNPEYSHDRILVFIGIVALFKTQSEMTLR